MYGKLIRVIYILIFLCACVSSSNPDEQYVESTIDIIDDFKSEKEYDLKMKSQLTDYLEAFNGGDVDKAVSYCYPDMFRYLQDSYPQEYSLEFVKKEFRKMLMDFNNENKLNNVKVEFELGEIIKRLETDSDILVVIVTKVKSKKGYDEIIMGGEVLAISSDEGDNWKFIQKDTETTSKVLKYRFSQESITQIMN